MNEQERLTYIHYRLDRAEKTLAEARTLFETTQMFGAVNRIYYAMFYAVSALAFAHGFTTVLAGTAERHATTLSAVQFS